MYFRNSILFCLILFCLQASFSVYAQPQRFAGAASPYPIKFLLTFDDGPSASWYQNPTQRIIEVLKTNSVQNEIKAVFFTQTRAKGAAGSDVGKQLLKRLHEADHILAFHTATPGHSNHRSLSGTHLDASLEMGIADLTQITGAAPEFVRPPFWSYDERTLRSYQQHHLGMILTDLSANDGVIYVFNFSLRKRRNLLHMLAAMRSRWENGALPQIDGATPIIVTFHDINRYTASHMDEYLNILLDVAKELNIPTTSQPFYADKEALRRATAIRVVDDAASSQNLPGIWNWWWGRM